MKKPSICQDRLGTNIRKQLIMKKRGRFLSQGILAGDPTEGTYVYGDAPSEVVQRAIAIQKICDEHGVALGGAKTRLLFC
jgi:hypothetical protein